MSYMKDSVIESGEEMLDQEWAAMEMQNDFEDAWTMHTLADAAHICANNPDMFEWLIREIHTIKDNS